MDMIDLDRTFRADSRARRVAERLLSGQSLTRQELASEAGVPRSAVNRVVEQLQALGAVVERDIVNREATFRVVGSVPAHERIRLPELDSEGQLVADELVGPVHMVTAQVGRRRFRGIAPGPVRVGDGVRVVGILREGPDAVVFLDRLSNGKRLRLSAVQGVGGTDAHPDV